MICSSYATFRNCFATTASLAQDGYEEWPVENLRINGFDGGFIGFARPMIINRAFPTINSLAVDSVAGVDEYDWWVSQRTDDPASQWLEVVTLDADLFPTGPDTHSGSISIFPSRVGAAAIGIEYVDYVNTAAVNALTINQDQMIALLKNVHIYVQRRSDKAIQWLDVLQYVMTRG